MERILISCIILLATACGCNGAAKLPGLVPAEGVVYYDDAPLADASVTFHAAEENDGLRGGFCKTDSDGRFRLSTLHPGDGIEPGRYIVTVVKYKPPSPPDPEQTRRALSGEATGPVSINVKPPENEIAPKYADRAASGIEISIDTKGSRQLEIKLASQ